METVNLGLPAELVSVAKLDQGDVSVEAAKFIAMELFREGTVSLAALLSCAGLPWRPSWVLWPAMGFHRSIMGSRSSSRTSLRWRAFKRDRTLRFLAAVGVAPGLGEFSPRRRGGASGAGWIQVHSVKKQKD